MAYRAHTAVFLCASLGALVVAELVVRPALDPPGSAPDAHNPAVPPDPATAFEGSGEGLLDLLPYSLRQPYIYWRWAYESGIKEWWDVPPEERYHVPDPVVEAFEKRGFIWGGKWVAFDPMHFEYRPEVFYLIEGALRGAPRTMRPAAW